MLACLSYSPIVYLLKLYQSSAATRIQQWWNLWRRRKHQAAKRRLATMLQNAYRSCNKSLFTTRKRLACVVKRLVPGGNVICPITQVFITTAALNCCDGMLYEADALDKWSKESGRCPTTRQVLRYIRIRNLGNAIQSLHDLLPF